MANTTFANLKINLLKKAGNNYNANDAARLTIAGGCINDAISVIANEIKGHPFTLDIGNTVSTVASQPYVDLTDTDIVEVLQVSQRNTNSKLRWIPYTTYIKLLPNPTILGGVPEALWTATQSVNGSGQNIWRLWFIFTPSSVVTIYYDYEKNLRFTADDSSQDAAFCPFPSVYDKYLYDIAKPAIYEILDPKNSALITRADAKAKTALIEIKRAILSMADGWNQAGSARENGPYIYKRVAATPIP